MNRYFISVFLIVIVLIPLGCNQKEKSLSVAGTNVYIGMTGEELSQGLQSKYMLEWKQGQTLGLIHTKPNQEPFHMAGGVSFKNNKVIEVTRNWGDSTNKEVIAFFNAIYDAIGDGGTVQVTKKSVSVPEVPGIAIADITLSFPDRTLKLSLTKHKDETSVAIYDSIGK